MPENCLNSVQMDSMFLRRHRVLTVMLEDYEIAVFMVIPPTHLFRKAQRERPYFWVCDNIILQGGCWRKWKWCLYMTESSEFSLVFLFQGFYRKLKKVQKYCMTLHAQSCICYVICLLCYVIDVAVNVSVIFLDITMMKLLSLYFKIQQ